MIRSCLFLSCLLLSIIEVVAQKKPLDHAVYDGWQRVGEKLVSADGDWAAYTVEPQEGDGILHWRQLEGRRYGGDVPRGYSVQFEPNSRFLFAKIKPPFAVTREAKIKKRKPEEMPRDSFLLVDLMGDSIRKIPNVKSYKFPDSTGGWVAWHMERVPTPSVKKTNGAQTDPKLDSLVRVIDSLKSQLGSMQAPAKKRKARDDESISDAEDDPAANGGAEQGTDLVVKNLRTGQERVIPNVSDYQFSKKGHRLAVRCSPDPRDSVRLARVLLLDLVSDSLYIVSKGGNDFRQFAFSEDGVELVFLAERDARSKELQKYYRVWHYRLGMDSAKMLIDRHTPGMPLGFTLSEFANLKFTPSTKRLLMGIAPIQPPKDTSRVEIDLVKLDVWHYKDDYLQTQQLFNLSRDLQRNYQAFYDLERERVVTLATPEMPQVLLSNEGDGEKFYGLADSAYRIESQWTGKLLRDLYEIEAETGIRKPIVRGVSVVLSTANVSPDGNSIIWYDLKKRQYVLWNGSRTRDISRGLPFPLWDEENDLPDDPSPYGFVGWLADGTACVVTDRYDLWRLDTAAKIGPTRLTLWGREKKSRIRQLRITPESKPWSTGQQMIFKSFRESDKREQLLLGVWQGAGLQISPITSITPHVFNAVQQSRNANQIIYTLENYQQSPNLFTRTIGYDDTVAFQLTQINPQQKEYNWGTAELYSWKAFNGKPAQGVLYKPENFDPKKKYPLILYFYETHTDALHQYIAPSPTGSRLNISFFVSRGYVVCSPDIRYTIGQPAQSAYDYVVSAAKSLAANPWIDSRNMGIQGQSWGGIQVAQLVTMTNLFKAAWSGAPVANMTSAYGGIRWESGLNRQFQYEKSQSRIGATLWERPDLYIKNSPLFQVPKIQTPMVIMANDADGAVPWYQGIELFTAMRRLGKPVWMLNYNGEAHNLRERKNQKDISVREQQFFDWLLKGEKPARWLTAGVPAIRKGKDWGLDTDQ
jgi:dipeptidyl aminopeptidase/acylaminoacyl peptidase